MNYNITKALVPVLTNLMLWHEKFKEKVQISSNTKHHAPNQLTSIQLMQVASCVCLVAFYAFPEVSFAIDDISDMKALTKKVQDEIQGNGITLVLNAVGISTALFALITSRWTTLLFGIGYLVFVNVFFGFVNGSFKIK